MGRDGGDGPAIGVTPIAPARHYGRLPLRHVAGWAHPNHFHGAPLVRAGFESLFWSILLGWCDAAPWARTLLHVPRLTEDRSEEHTSELQSLMRHSYAVFCLKKKQN